MGAIAALIPLVQALIGSGAVPALGAISFTQWVSIGAAVWEAGPQIRKAWAALHPAFDQLVSALENTGGDTVTGARSVQHWISANQQASSDIQDRMGEGAG